MKKKLMLERAQRERTTYPCKYDVGAIVPAAPSAWEGSPWRAFLFLARR